MARTPTTVVPPPGLFAKLGFYSRKYGFLNSLARYVGRWSSTFWNLVGPRMTSGVIRRWLARPGPHLLNLGGGSHCLDEVLTVDIDPRADAYVNVCRPLPFGDASLDGIFCEEVIEHVPLAMGRALLKECARILKPGAPLRLTTPDLCWFASRLLGNPSDPSEINSIFYDHGHRHLFTPDELERECLAVGFRNPRRSHYQDDNSALGWLDSHADRFSHPPEISQYIEVNAPT